MGEGVEGKRNERLRLLIPLGEPEGEGESSRGRRREQ